MSIVMNKMNKKQIEMTLRLSGLDGSRLQWAGLCDTDASKLAAFTRGPSGQRCYH